MPGLTTGTSPNLVKTALDKVFYSEYDYADEPGIATAENGLLFKIQTIDRSAQITEEWSNVGLFDTHSEDETRILANLRTANQKTHTVLNFKKTVPIPQEYFEDDQHGSVNAMVANVAQRARITRDHRAFIEDGYGDGFSGTLSSDGVALFSNSHTNLNGDTIDNLETGALTAANLEILFRVLMIQKGQDGELGGHVPVALLVPTILWPDAQEITKSELKAHTTDNTLNYFSTAFPGLQVFHSPLLGSAYNGATNADTSYYLVGRNHSMMRYVRIPMETKLIPPDTDLQDRWYYKARFREIVSPISWEGLAASQGTA